MSHWTQGGVSDFVYNISLDFFTQVEDRIHESKLPQKELAQRLSVSPSAVSQMLNSPPDKPELETLVKYARAVGSKVAVVLYNDEDPNNERGPIYSGIFEQSWQTLGKPRDLDAVKEAKSLLDFSINDFSAPNPAKFYGGGFYYFDCCGPAELPSPENIGSTLYVSYMPMYGNPGNPGIRQNSTVHVPGNILTQVAPQKERDVA